jgi:tetratricopeptide (TPR) repeat protein
LKSFAQLLIICSLIASAGAAHAESRTAKISYERGVKQYNLGHFAEAISEFEKAYEADGAPVLLFNIAQAHWKLGNNSQAVFFYRRYLESAPKSDRRADVEKRVAELEAVIQRERDAKATPAPQAEPNPTSPPALASHGSAASGGNPAVALAAPDHAPAPENAEGATVVATQPADSGAAASEGAGGGVTRRWWFWTALGAVVVGGAVAAFVATRSHDGIACPAGVVCPP